MGGLLYAAQSRCTSRGPYPGCRLPHLEQTRRTCSHHARRGRRFGHHNPDALRAFFQQGRSSLPAPPPRSLESFFGPKSSRSPAQVCRRVLDFFLAHPNDYRLITEDWATAFARKEEMPSFEFLKRNLAAQL